MISKTSVLSAFGTCLLVACSSASVPAGNDDSGSGDSAPVDARASDTATDSPAELTWYTTCGAPVCMVPEGGLVDAGEGCPPIGSSCTKLGETCGTPSQENCDTNLICDNHDPKGAGGEGCPISTRSFKDDIAYLGENDLQALHDDALSVKLATYNYKPAVADPTQPHLGFIIEDQPESFAVDRLHHRVDLYGYVSMAIAGMQIQEREIAALRAELDSTKREAALCRATRR
jgi:hypothetical protein